MYSEFLVVKLINKNLGLKLKGIEGKSRLKNPVVSLEEVAERTYLIELSLKEKAFQWKESRGEKFKFYGEAVLEDTLYEFASELPSNCSSLELKKEGRGSFVVVSKAGYGIKIKNDPLSLSPIYHYQDDDVFVCSNMPLIMESALLGLVGKKLTRTAQLAAYEALLRRPMFGKTSWEEVGLLSYDTEILLSDRGVIFERLHGDGYFLSPQETYSDLLAQGIDELVGNVRALANSRYEYKIADLTGGMDSRLILSAIINQGLESRFLFHTNGSYPVADANVAFSIMNKFGLKSVKVSGLREGSLSNNLVREMSYFVHCSQGMRVVYDRALESEYVQPNLIKLGGALGGGFKMSKSGGAPDDLEKFKLIDDLMVSSDVQLNEKFKESVKEDLDKYIESFIKAGGTLKSVYDWVMVDSSNRYFNSIGEYANHPVRPKFHALYSPCLVRACMALKDNEKVSGKVHYDVMAKLSPELVHIPFADNSWSSALVSSPPEPVTVKSVKLYEDPEFAQLKLHGIEDGNNENLLKAAMPNERRKWIAQQKGLGRNWMWQNLDLLHDAFREIYSNNASFLESYFDKKSLERLEKINYRKIRRNSDARALVSFMFVAIFLSNSEVACKVDGGTLN